MLYSFQLLTKLAVYGITLSIVINAVQFCVLEVIVMAFIREVISSEDAVWFNSLGIKDWTGHGQETAMLGRAFWYIDRKKHDF